VSASWREGTLLHIRRDLGSPRHCEYMHAIELVNEGANHQGQQIDSGTAVPALRGQRENRISR
jgi:hypothetical protein